MQQKDMTIARVKLHKSMWGHRQASAILHVDGIIQTYGPTKNIIVFQSPSMGRSLVEFVAPSFNHKRNANAKSEGAAL